MDRRSPTLNPKMNPAQKPFSLSARLAAAGAALVLLLAACAWVLRGTLLWPISTHVKVNFTQAGMVVESTAIPRVNGVYFEISNNTAEPHQVVVFHEGIPYTTKGFIEEWQPVHRDAGKTVEPGQAASYQGIYVYEGPLTAGRHFLLFCNEPAHYARGEHVELVVK
jgi:hypothetical protein